MMQFIIGLIVGTNISLFLYALILCGAKSEEKINEKQENEECEEITFDNFW